MTRFEKLAFIKKEFPELHATLKEKVPNLFKTPMSATSEDIALYNKCLADDLKSKGYTTILIRVLIF